MDCISQSTVYRQLHILIRESAWHVFRNLPPPQFFAGLSISYGTWYHDVSYQVDQENKQLICSLWLHLMPCLALKCYTSPSCLKRLGVAVSSFVCRCRNVSSWLVCFLESSKSPPSHHQACSSSRPGGCRRFRSLDLYISEPQDRGPSRGRLYPAISPPIEFSSSIRVIIVPIIHPHLTHPQTNSLIRRPLRR